MVIPTMPHPVYDYDIISGEVLWEDICKCGHPRHEHFAATGALGSFGGTACGECWTCSMFRKDEECSPSRSSVP